MSELNRLLGVVLCGGKSSAGWDRISLALRLPALDSTYLEYAAVRSARNGLRCQSLQSVVHGNSNAWGPSDLRFGPIVPDPSCAIKDPQSASLLSLRFCSRSNNFAACFFTPVDMPDLSVDDLKKIQLSWQKTRQLTAATTDHVQPLVAIYPTGLLQDIGRLAHSSDRSLSRWITSQDCHLVPLAQQACRNINAPEDLRDG